MRFLPTRIHGLLDYTVAVILIGLPYLVDAWIQGGPAVCVPMALGVGTIGYSLLTRYELSVLRVIPMPVHLGLDIASGIVLAASPWVFGFAAITWFPYVLFGIFEIVAGLVTQTQPSRALPTAA